MMRLWFFVMTSIASAIISSMIAFAGFTSLIAPATWPIRRGMISTWSSKEISLPDFLSSSIPTWTTKSFTSKTLSHHVSLLEQVGFYLCLSVLLLSCLAAEEYNRSTWYGSCPFAQSLLISSWRLFSQSMTNFPFLMRRGRPV